MSKLLKRKKKLVFSFSASQHTPVTLWLIHLSRKKKKNNFPRLGCIIQWAPQFDQFPFYLVCFASVWTPPPFVAFVSASAFLSQPPSLTPAPHQSLFCRTIFSALPLFLWPLSSLSPQITGVPMRKPLKVMFYYNFRLADFLPQLLYTLLPIDIHSLMAHALSL